MRRLCLPLILLTLLLLCSCARGEQAMKPLVLEKVCSIFTTDPTGKELWRFIDNSPQLLDYRLSLVPKEPNPPHFSFLAYTEERDYWTQFTAKVSTTVPSVTVAAKCYLANETEWLGLNGKHVSNTFMPSLWFKWSMSGQFGWATTGTKNRLVVLGVIRFPDPESVRGLEWPEPLLKLETETIFLK